MHERERKGDAARDGGGVLGTVKTGFDALWEETLQLCGVTGSPCVFSSSFIIIFVCSSSGWVKKINLEN